MSQIPNKFHANGKLLITGEYFILDGAVGLALPTKFGQTLTVSSINSERQKDEGITWESIDDKNNVWFEAKFNEDLEIISSTDSEVAQILKNILSHCNLTTHDLRLTTKLDFPQNWGLGSSSTLISLLAQWSDVDPYELLAKTFGGSGYDIACATATQPIIYQKISNLKSQISNPVNFNPSFKENLYFVYLGKKQNSREGIQHYKDLTVDKTEYIEQISNITQKIIQANELDEFSYYLDVHENIVSNVLQLKKVKDIYFPDFPGSIKSLGAWGGDFILVASDEDALTINKYFFDKGFSTILSYNEMIL